MVDDALGWLPWPSIRGYVVLTMLLAVGLAGSFLLRSASIRNLHYVPMPKALLVFLQEPAAVSQGRIENEAVRILAAQPDRMASVPVFYVLSNKKKLRHLLLDSGITREALIRASLPDASWYLVEAWASYGAGRTIMRSPEEALRVSAVRKLKQVYYAPRNSLDGRVVPYELPDNSSYSHARMPIL